jgi:hypothetical protein
MCITITTRKIVPGNGLTSRQIITVNALSERELPVAYMKATPHCYLNTVGALNINTDPDHSWKTDYIRPDDIIEENQFQALIGKLADCGEALAAVNRRIKTLRQQWCGEETFIV